VRPLHEIFIEVPPRYDLMNRLLTLHLDERWREKAAAECLAGAPRRVLDLCTGTGDLALRLARSGRGLDHIAALDFSAPMLDAARRKAERRDLREIEFVEADAADMPFRDGSFDTVGIAFAFRNLTFRNPGRDRYLAEILRVIRAGGRFVIVESSQPENSVLRALSHAYVSLMACGVAGILSGHPGAYRYLARSVIRFSAPEELRRMLKGAGFSEARHTPLLGGAAGITVAVK
jgi:demethylmenaquinone methyltransferase/2-methoxy-6-polyprenyl-1,4-benzoquinol methylase